MIRRQIDINCDMGEIIEIDDQSLMPYISSCNISCGAHSKSVTKIEQTIKAAVQAGLKIGAHPSYPDRENFGRQSMEMSQSEFVETLMSQLTFLQAKVEDEGGQLHHVKAHGALYNDLMRDENLLRLFLSTIKDFDPEILVYGYASSKAQKLAQTYGIKYCSEVFMDRRYLSPDQLMPRSQATAVLENKESILNQLEQLLQGCLITAKNQKFEITWDTICLHSDTPNALSIAKIVFDYLNQQGYEIN